MWRGLLLVVAVVGLATGCSHAPARPGGLPGLATSGPATTRPPTQGSPTVASSPTASSPTSPPTGAPNCAPAQLSLAAEPTQGAAGHYEETLVFTDVGSTPCGLFGYPGVAFLSAQGRPLPTEPNHHGNVMIANVPPRRVTLRPGGKASFGVSGSNFQAQSGGSCPSAAGLAVIPPNDTTALTVHTTLPYCGHGQVTVSPVVVGAAGPT
jgi:hypothetical protein